MSQAVTRAMALLAVMVIVFPLAVLGGAVGAADPGPALAANDGWEQIARAQGLPDDAITALTFGPHGTLWAGTLRGLAQFDGHRWRSGPAAWAIGTPWITALATDGDGRVWVGTRGDGLYRRERGSWRPVSPPVNEPTTALAVDQANQLWVATFGGGIAVSDAEIASFDMGPMPNLDIIPFVPKVTGIKLTIWSRHTPRDGLAGPWVQALAVDHAGNVWAGTWGHGLGRFDGQSWRTFGVGDGLPDARVNALAVDAAGTLWVGTDAGLARFDGTHWQSYTAADGLPDERISALVASAEGTLWVGTPRGLARWEDAGFVAVPLRAGPRQPYVSALAVGPAGSLWVGTLGDGLYRRHSLPSALPVSRAPVVLIHGWHGPPSDDVADSQLKFMARWLRDDGYAVFYAQGITADRTLAENAQALQRAITLARRETGAGRVHLIGHSMGGLVARAYVESSGYANDVASVIMLGTPNGGLGLWYNQLARWIQGGNAEPALIELTPQFMAEFNATHQPRDYVPYLLVAGDLSERLDVLRGWPANDGLIERASVFAVPGVQVATDDAHGWTDDTILYSVPAYTWPRQTYERYVRPWLDDCHTAPTRCAAVVDHPPPLQRRHPSHTPFVTRRVAAGATMTVPLAIEQAESARLFLTWEGGDLRFRLVEPGGRQLDGERHNGNETFAFLRLDDAEIVPFALYRIEQPQVGSWQLVIENRGTHSAEATTYAMIEDGQELTASTARFQWSVGEPVTLRAEWTDNGEPVRDGLVVAEVPDGDGGYRSLAMADDGSHGDGKAGDGVYAARFVVRAAGHYVATVTARHADRGPRSQEVIFVVEESSP